MHPMMHVMVAETLVRERQRRFESRMRSAQHVAERRGAAAPAVSVLLRLSTVHDGGALARLSQLEGRPTPASRHVVAEVDGSIVAAFPLAGGSPLADPFRPTAELLPLLELRATQLTEDRPFRRSRAVWRAIRAWGI